MLILKKHFSHKDVLASSIGGLRDYIKYGVNILWL